MMRIRAIRLSGFKSFAEEMEIPVEAGLNVVVGPNGCGKSNIIEAVRWVMGEGSAKRLRGAEMDDVIFGGSSARRRRQSAEVALVIENPAGLAPEPFQNAEQLVISRRIERGQGSVYRINDQEVRARDVQMLFADLSIGSRSSSIVSQGQAAELVESKPDARRLLLEEAAGVRGLHARRHDARLKLSQAEENLVRVQDILKAERESLDLLERQAESASRYRALTSQKRQLEAARWWRQVSTARQRLDDLVQQYGVAEGACETTRTVRSQASAEMTRAEAALLRARQGESEAVEASTRNREALYQHQREVDRLVQEQERDRERADELAAELTRLEENRSSWCQREAELEDLRVSDDFGSGDDLDEEIESQAQTLAALSAEQEEARSALAEAEGRMVAARQLRVRHEERLASLKARRQQAEAEVDDAEDHLERQAGLLRELPETLKAEEGEQRDWGAEQDRVRLVVKEAFAALAEARVRPDQLAEALAGVEAGQTRLREQEQRLKQARDQWRQWQESQRGGLGAVWSPPEGLARALEAALGGGMNAGQDRESGFFWRHHAGSGEKVSSHVPPPLPLPSLAAVLAEAGVSLPEGWGFLSDVLHWVGLGDDFEVIEGCADRLQPGQLLVTRAGGWVRWDGLARPVGEVKADDWSAGRLCRVLEDRCVAYRAELEECMADATGREAAWRSDMVEAERRFSEAERAQREVQAEMTAEQERRRGRDVDRRRLQEKRLRIEAEIETTEANRLRWQERLQTLEGELEKAGAESMSGEKVEDLEPLRLAVADVGRRLQVLEASQIRREAEREAEQARQEEYRAERERIGSALTGLDRQHGELRLRRQEIDDRAGLLAERLGRAEAVRAACEAGQGECGAVLEAARQTLQEAQAAQTVAGQALHRNEMALAQATQKLEQLGEERRHGEETLRSLHEMVRGEMRVEPRQLKEHYSLDEAMCGLSPESLAARIEQTTRRLERLGAVNLRADIDAGLKRESIAGIESEREDIGSAIVDLESAINDLNRQGRVRLQATFRRMSDLFAEHVQTLFSGGEAKLTWLESDDPIAPGLGIEARPPGKTMQSVHLLSGGEKSLIALGLIAAVLRLQPTPICLLDEVDAALDDANVDRFCGLLRDLAASLPGMRFIVISHHRLTMAQADHLLGVGMPERGVSRLYAVDMLDRAGVVDLPGGVR